jgi:hypothetical protein
MGKQSVHASLRLRRIKNELSFSVLLKHRVVVIYCHRTIGTAVGRSPNPKNSVVQTIRYSRHPNYSHNQRDEDSSQPRSEVWGRRRSHDARL